MPVPLSESTGTAIAGAVTTTMPVPPSGSTGTAWAGPASSAATAASTAVVINILVVVMSFMSRLLLDRSTMRRGYERAGGASCSAATQLV
jgi:hypothetical protein